jgi:DNA-binding NtrC family response regulator
MNGSREGASAPGVEKFSVSAAGERWLDFLTLEHATLPLPVAFSRQGDEWIVRRSSIAGRRIAAGRIPRDQASLLFLQAAGLCAFLQAFGFWIDEEDLSNAIYDRAGGVARLWLTRTPASVQRGGPGPAPSAVLAAALHRLFARDRRMGFSAARSLLDRLVAPDAAFRRAEFWLASAFRAFPELGGAEAACARIRTLGCSGRFGRDASTRARLEAASEELQGRQVRVFQCQTSALTPGGALGLLNTPERAADASRQLRERHEREKSGRTAVWIAVEPRRWDELSRRAFESAVHALERQVDVRIVEGASPSPQLADEWRRELFVPCGTLSASLRFYEEFAERIRSEPARAREIAEQTLASQEWGRFVADPTGSSPVPWPRVPPSSTPVSRAPDVPAGDRAILECLAAHELPIDLPSLSRLFSRRRVTSTLASLESRGEAVHDWSGSWRATQVGRQRAPLSETRRRGICRHRAEAEENPARRVELLLAAGANEEALEHAETWYRGSASLPNERWFALSARLSRVPELEAPAWVQLLEAERELAGGHAEDAEKRLSAVSESSEALPAERRIASLRAAEVQAHRGLPALAGQLAASWRESYPDAPAGEKARCLRLEAMSLARQGAHPQALSLLDEAALLAGAEDLDSSLETALSRGDVLSAAGRFEEETRIYESWRPRIAERQDDLLTARFLAREALGLSDRRDFQRAAARLEQALGVLRDDASLRAELLMDLASVLYHAGRQSACAPLIEEAIVLASAVGRQDLLRGARSNRLELWINECRWDEASREIDVLLRRADEEKDEVWRQVILHHRSRLALRRGRMEEAAQDNAEARALAARLRDRLEVGELWLEEGDRCLYIGDLEGAERAYTLAAEDPPDRCDSGERAKQRLADLRSRTGLAPGILDSLQADFQRDEYAAAERAARWHMLRGGQCGAADPLCRRAEAVLRARGGERLAERVFGRREAVRASVTLPTLGALRAAVAARLAGQESETPLAPLGLTALVVKDSDGNDVIRWGTVSTDGSATQRWPLCAGSTEYDLEMAPPLAEDAASSIAFVLESMLYRVAPAAPPAEFVRGWKRLGVVAGDSAMEEPYRRLIRFAPQPVTVLILGESGSGKEAVARAVHSLSARASGPFVPVNIPAIPPALLESELFGHVRGAFTGADRERRGLFEEAHGGTIFFDEIGDLTAPLQAKLLRALQEREIRRIGENRSRSIDVRVVSATSRQLEHEVESGAFREDLYYRLHVAVIRLPALRDRGRDAGTLARHFLERFAHEYAKGNLQYSPEALSALAAYSWPGNVRELQSAIAQAAALAEPNATVGLELLPEAARRPRRTAASADYRTRVDAHRRGLISEALERSGGNRSRAARELGLSRQALLYLIRELNVTSRPRSGH